MALFTLYLNRLNTYKANKWFKRLQLISSAAFSIGHGGNDAQKAMGIIAAAMIAAGQITDVKNMPYWVPFACHLAMGLGTLTGVENCKNYGYQNYKSNSLRRGCCGNCRCYYPLCNGST